MNESPNIQSISLSSTKMRSQSECLTYHRFPDEAYKPKRIREKRLQRVHLHSEPRPSGSVSLLSFISDDIRDKLRAVQSKRQRSLNKRNGDK